MTRHPAESTGQVTKASHHLHDFFNRLRLPLYAVLDAARDPRMLSLLAQSGCDYRILYGSKLAATMDGLGPYLVALPRGTPFLLRLIEKGWGNSWGIFLTCPAALPAVRRHLRRSLGVKFPDGSHALFRFYDPRVLRDHLPSCGDEELDRFFGPIHSIYLEPTTGQELNSSNRVLEFANEHPLVRNSYSTFPKIICEDL